MTDIELREIEARAKAALTYERSEYVAEEGMYVSPVIDGRDTEENMTCPLCNGDGEVEGQRYDAKEECASTVVAYGIGKGLGLAEDWVEQGPRDALALVSEVRRLTSISAEDSQTLYTAGYEDAEKQGMDRMQQSIIDLLQAHNAPAEYIARIVEMEYP